MRCSSFRPVAAETFFRSMEPTRGSLFLPCNESLVCPNERVCNLSSAESLHIWCSQFASTTRWSCIDGYDALVNHDYEDTWFHYYRDNQLVAVLATGLNHAGKVECMQGPLRFEVPDCTRSM